MTVKFIKKPENYDVGMCPVSSVQLEGFSPSKISKIIDYSNDIYENSIYHTRTHMLEYGALDPTNFPLLGSGFPITYYETTIQYSSDFLITNRLSDNNDPLFYSYELKFDVNGITDTDIVEVLKNNSQPLRPNQYKLEFGDVSLTDNYYGSKDTSYDRYGNGIVWGNINSTGNIHRVRLLLPLDLYNQGDFYTVRYNKSLFNISYPNHFELIELEPLYVNGTDWTIEHDSVIIPNTSKISTNKTKSLYITKDPSNHIAVDGVISMNSDAYQNDAESSWRVRVNHGSFLTNIDEQFYQTSFVPNDPTSPTEKYQLVTYVNPKLLGGNIVKVEESPIHVSVTDNNGVPSGYIYPYYDIDIFPKKSLDTIIPIGTFGIDIDGVDIQRTKISSIDRKKGFILFNKQFSPQDNVDLFFYTDCASKSYVYNFELNPRISVDEYGMSSNCTTTIKNLGIAVRKSPSAGITDIYENKLKYKSLWFFNFDAVASNGTVTAYRCNQIPQQTTVSETLTLRWNPYNGYSSSTGDLIPITHISINRLFPDILKIRDARVIGGGVTTSEEKRLNNEQRNSYTDVGYWDGEPLPHAGLVIIHIPSTIYPSLVQNWKDSGLFNPELYTDITQEEIKALIESDSEYAEYYTKLLEGYAQGNSKVKDSFDNMLTLWAKKEASHYLDQLIKKYIPAGTQYILLNENFDQITLEL